MSLTLLDYKNKNLTRLEMEDMIIKGSDYDNYLALGLSIIATVALLLLLLVLFFQIKFIASNETTSESIRRPSHIVNIYDNGCKRNCKEYFTNITAYRNTAVYNDAAIMFLKNSVLITDHFHFLKTRGSVKDISKKTSVRSEVTASSNIEMNISRVSQKSDLTTTIKNLIEGETDSKKIVSL